MPKLKEYLVEVPVKAARGHQTWAIRARSVDDAIARFHAGEGTMIDDEIEVIDIGEPHATLNY